MIILVYCFCLLLILALTAIIGDNNWWISIINLYQYWLYMPLLLLILEQLFKPSRYSIMLLIVCCCLWVFQYSSIWKQHINDVDIIQIAQPIIWENHKILETIHTSAGSIKLYKPEHAPRPIKYLAHIERSSTVSLKDMMVNQHTIFNESAKDQALFKHLLISLEEKNIKLKNIQIHAQLITGQNNNTYKNIINKGFQDVLLMNNTILPWDLPISNKPPFTRNEFIFIPKSK